MNAAELSRMHDYHQAALHAVREGLLMLDGQYRVALMNDGGRGAAGGDGRGRRTLRGRTGAAPTASMGALLSARSRGWTRCI